MKKWFITTMLKLTKAHFYTVLHYYFTTLDTQEFKRMCNTFLEYTQEFNKGTDIDEILIFSDNWNKKTLDK